MYFDSTPVWGGSNIYDTSEYRDYNMRGRSGVIYLFRKPFNRNAGAKRVFKVCDDIVDGLQPYAHANQVRATKRIVGIRRVLHEIAAYRGANHERS